MKYDNLDDVARSAVTLQTPVSERIGGQYHAIGKRLCDLLLAALILPILAPVIAVLWVLTRRDGGAGFFGHLRVGKDGKAFRCWKIRTMVVDAEAKLKTYLAENPEAAAEWARDFKIENDPRITPLGKFLRRTSLDELPQILNVLKGEMSFVGPRPVVADELQRYGADRTYYTALTPGITGLWQVSGRNDVSYDERIEMDVTYFNTVSFASDFSILLKTFGAVTNATGK